MKKNITISRILLCIFLVLSIESNTYGQNVKMNLGIKAGVNLSTVSNTKLANPVFNPGFNTDFHLGVLTNFHFGRRGEGSPIGTGLFGLQVELLYSRQGFLFKNETIHFDYLTLPILAQYYATNHFWIESGAFISYLMETSPAFIMIDGTSINLSSLKKGTDVGIAIGVGYGMLSGFTINARYMLGISKLAKNLPWKNTIMAISVGWLF